MRTAERGPTNWCICATGGGLCRASLGLGDLLLPAKWLWDGMSRCYKIYSKKVAFYIEPGVDFVRNNR